MTKWEKKIKYEKTWVNATAYFEDLVADIKKYQSISGGTAKWELYKSTTNGREEHQQEVDIIVCFDPLLEASTLEKEHVQKMSNTKRSMVSLSMKLQ